MLKLECVVVLRCGIACPISVKGQCGCRFSFQTTKLIKHVELDIRLDTTAVETLKRLNNGIHIFHIFNVVNKSYIFSTEGTPVSATSLLSGRHVSWGVGGTIIMWC